MSFPFELATVRSETGDGYDVRLTVTDFPTEAEARKFADALFELLKEHGEAEGEVVQ